MNAIKSIPNYMTLLGLTPVPKNEVVNGYEISPIEFSKQWAAIKVGEIRGKLRL
jgi:hypothetical protein